MPNSIIEAQETLKEERIKLGLYYFKPLRTEGTFGLLDWEDLLWLDALYLIANLGMRSPKKEGEKLLSFLEKH